jgi:flagellar hook protein FlgE
MSVYIKQKAQLENQIGNGGGGSTATKDREILRLEGENAKLNATIISQKSSLQALSNPSQTGLQNALAEITTLKANIVQKDMEIQRSTATFNHTVAESDKMKIAYDVQIADITAKYTQIFQKKQNDDQAWNDLLEKHKELKAELASSKGDAASPPPDVPPVYIPSLHGPTAIPDPAAAPAQAGGGFMGMFGFGAKKPAASTTPAASDAAGVAGGVYYTDADLDGMNYRDLQKLSVSLGLGGKGSENVIRDRIKEFYQKRSGAPLGGAAALQSPVQTSPAADGRAAGGAAAVGDVRGRVAAFASQFNAMPFVDPMEMNSSVMKTTFKASPWSIHIDATSETSTFTSIITSAQYQPLVNQLAREYNIDQTMSSSEKTKLLINVYKLTRYIFNLDSIPCTTFVHDNNLVLTKQHITPH